MAELQVYSDGENVTLQAQVEALDSIERGLWSKRYLVDGYASQYRLIEWPEWLIQEQHYVERAAEIQNINARWEMARDRASTTMVRSASAFSGLIALLQ